LLIELLSGLDLRLAQAMVQASADKVFLLTPRKTSGLRRGASARLIEEGFSKTRG